MTFLSLNRPSLLQCLACWFALIAIGAQRASADPSLFQRSNLVAWCIVPFDAKKRSPEERAAMLERLGFTQFAYDYRAEHIPAFDAEMEALKRHHIRLLAWWFPTTLNDEARLILDVLKRHELHTQLWVMGGGDPAPNAEAQRVRVQAEAARIKPIAEAAQKIGCTIGLYNHGGWFGEPENQIAVLERLRTQSITNIGIVYNQHHGHEHLDRFPELLRKMTPYLLALNLNGMVQNGEKMGKQILPIGTGDMDLSLLRVISESGWRGPIGILNHTGEDAEVRLRENLAGLDRLVAQLEKKGGATAAPAPPSKYWAVEDPKAREKPSGDAHVAFALPEK